MTEGTFDRFSLKDVGHNRSGEIPASSGITSPAEHGWPPDANFSERGLTNTVVTVSDRSPCGSAQKPLARHRHLQGMTQDKDRKKCRGFVWLRSELLEERDGWPGTNEWFF